MSQVSNSPTSLGLRKVGSFHYRSQTVNHHKPLPQPPNSSLSTVNKPRPTPLPTPSSSTFQPITDDEEELLSLLRMDGANMFVIGLWSDMEATSSSRRLSKIRFDTMCYISEDGSALVCESDMVPSSSSASTSAQRRSNIILFSEVEKIIPYCQCSHLLENFSAVTTTTTSSTTSLSISSKIPITQQEAQECVSFFQRYFISGYNNKEPNYEAALVPYKFQMFMVKRKNFKKSLGFILSDPMQASTWIKGLQMFMDDSRGILSASSVARTANRNVIPEPQTLNDNEENGSSPNKKMHKKHLSFGESIKQKLKVSSKASTGTEVADALGNEEYMSSPNSGGFSPRSAGTAKPLPIPVKKESTQSPLLPPTISTETSSEIAKQLQKLKKTPATPTSNSNNTNLEVKNDSNAQTNEDKQLFEVVVVVKLRRKDDKLEPFIHYEFPPQTGRSSKSQQIINSVPLFCFPDIDIVKEQESISGGNKKTYSFVLTDIDGTRKHGYCRRMLPTGTGKRLPETFCIISAHSCFGLFSTILDNIEIRNEINNVSCYQFLKTVLANPFPSPGTCTIIRTVNPKSGQQEEVKLSRPNVADPMLEYINFNVLFECLSAENLLTVFSFLLTERRIICFAKDITKLSSFCQAIISLLYPFTWQHIFIPVLPQSLIDYVCSPVPFVIGVLSNHKQYIDELRKDGQMESEVLQVDLDSGKVIEPATLKDNKSIIPDVKEFIKKLSKVSKEITSSKSGSNQIAMAKDTFLLFFVNLFGDYKAFVKPNQEFYSITDNRKKKDIPEWIFDTPLFIETKTKQFKKNGKFFTIFTQCQMFERWSSEIANSSSQKKGNTSEYGLFEQLSSVLQQQITNDLYKK